MRAMGWYLFQGFVRTGIIHGRWSSPYRMKTVRSGVCVGIWGDLVTLQLGKIPPLPSRSTGLELWAETGEPMTGTGAAQPRGHDLGANILASLTAVPVAELKVDPVIDP